MVNPHRRYQHHPDVHLPFHFEVLRFDGVSVLRVGDFRVSIDIRRRVDISSEELLALSERIGTLNTGLSEEKVNKNLKTRTYLEIDSCTICQENFKSQEKIRTLDCGHEYHAECLKKWLFVKNVCPLCKSKALAM